MQNSHLFDCSILNIIEWIKSNIDEYLSSDKETSDLSSSSSDQAAVETGPRMIEFSRMFVYSHHIFSPDKRREVMGNARDLNLTGFLMPGKPGVICVEGSNSGVLEFWSRLKLIQWQKLQMKVSER